MSSKFSFEGGSNDSGADFTFRGSVTAPTGERTGFQLDAQLGAFHGSVLGGVGAHLFVRDPEEYLLGLYSSYHRWESFNIFRFGAEGEFYWNNISLRGLAGYEWLDVPRTRDRLVVVNRDERNPFAVLDFSIYPNDKTRLTGGYSYENKQSFARVGFETLLKNTKVPTSLYAHARSNFKNDDSIHAGVKIHLGGDPSKPLIRRHREDGLQAYSPVFPAVKTRPLGVCISLVLSCPNGGAVLPDPYNACRFPDCPGGVRPTVETIPLN